MHKFIAFILVIYSVPMVLHAQITLSEAMDMPNQRFLQTIHLTQHPGLTFNGFKSPNDNNGLSVESVINKIYFSDNISDNILVVSLFNDIVNNANINSITDPRVISENGCNYNRSKVNVNSRVLQNLAFVALISYVANQEGIDVLNPPNGRLPLPSPSIAMSTLKSAFIQLIGFEVLGMPCNDQVHRVGSITNISRAVDLYLALENAYKYYEGIAISNFTSPYFLTQSEKQEVMSKMKSNVEGLIIHLTTSYLGVQVDEIEPGNRPLILYASAAYSILTIQSTTHYQATGFNYSGINFLEEAMRRSLKQAGTDSRLYWGYQTNDGLSFWAEGQYYFELTFDRVFPFWHALRINGITPSNFTYNDPFFSEMVRRPMEWMAQTYEPGGYIAPIDDGNKSLILSSSFLRWSSIYGNQGIGQRYSHIASEIDSSTEGVGLDMNMQIHELSVPRTLSKTPPDSKWGNTTVGVASASGKHEIVFRFTDNFNKQHYVYLNGEVGNAIIRGEGHEQPDQLQFLYSVDKHSYLMDSGYDEVESGSNAWDYVIGEDFNRSTWNNYRDHNVLLTYIPWINMSEILPNPRANLLGGLKHPERYIGDNRVVSNHTSVSELYLGTNVPNNIDVAYGKIKLGSPDMGGYWADDAVEHRRNLLFIKDPNGPYLVDISMGYTVKWNQPAFFLNIFHGNSNKLPVNLENSDYAIWTEIDGQLDKHLYLYSDNVEGNRVNDTPSNATFYSDTVRETNDDTKEIKRLNLYSQDLSDLDLYDYSSTNVSFIKSIIGPNETALLSNPPIISQPSRYLTTNQEKAEQMYTWDINSYTKDILVVRSGFKYANIQSYTPQQINITIESIDLHLPANRDFGFIRLIKINNVWQVDMDYRLNIELGVYSFATSQTINNVSFPLNAEVEISDNQTLTITGDVQFHPGTTVTLGTNASILVSGSGKITADGTTFTSVDPSNPALAYNRIELNTVGNSFTNSVFKGGSFQNVLVTKSGNVFTSCTFTNSQRGISVLYGGQAILNGSTVTNNHTGVYVSSGVVNLWGNEVHDPIDNTYSFTPTSVHGNSGQGVHAAGTGQVYMGLARVMDNAGAQIQVGNDARLYAEEIAPDNPTLLLSGHNRISNSSSGWYIYSTARTQSGETYQNWTIPARFNFWGNTSAPDANRFFGSINRSDHLSFDPTIPYVEQIPCIGPPESCPVQNSQIASHVLSSSMAGSLAKRASTTEEAERLIVTKERILAIRNHISAYPDDPFNARLLREWHGLLQGEGSSNMTDEKQLFSTRIETRKNQHAADMVLARSTGRFSGGGREWNSLSDGFRPDSELEQRHLIGETAWILSLALLADQGEYQVLLDQSAQYGTRIFNADNRASVQVYRMQALQSLGRYEEAISALNELERIQPSADMQANYIAQDYGPVRRYLAEMAGVDVNATLAKSNATMDHTGTPHTFALHPSFPNPFNPTTTVRYLVGGSNGSSAQVRIAVFDLLGREVAVLVNERQQAGEYSHVFDASEVASGIYLIHAQLGTQVFSHKITLIK